MPIKRIFFLNFIICASSFKYMGLLCNCFLYESESAAITVWTVTYGCKNWLVTYSYPQEKTTIFMGAPRATVWEYTAKKIRSIT